MSEPIMKNPDMSPGEVKQLCDETHKLFLSPKYAFGRMLPVRSFEDLKFSFRGAGSQGFRSHKGLHVSPITVSCLRQLCSSRTSFVEIGEDNELRK